MRLAVAVSVRELSVSMQSKIASAFLLAELFDKEKTRILLCAFSVLLFGALLLRVEAERAGRFLDRLSWTIRCRQCVDFGLGILVGFGLRCSNSH